MPSKEYKREYRKRNLERERARGREDSRKFRAENVEHLIQWSKERYARKRIELLQRQKDYRIANRDRIRQRDREYYAKRRAIKLEQFRIRRMKNPEKFREIDRNRKTHRAITKKQRYHSDIQYRIKCLLRTRLFAAIKTQGARKCGSISQLIGCSIPDLLIYLESKFEPGMTWGNYGPVWHVDHIMPLAIFDLTNESHQIRAFHFSNLQPLFALENCSKNSNVITNQFNLL